MEPKLITLALILATKDNLEEEDNEVLELLET